MISHVAVILPAHNEGEHIDAALTAIEMARLHLRRYGNAAVSSSVVVVLDDCQDDTADRLARHRDVRAVTCSARQVGSARRRGAEAALTTLAEQSIARGATWLANTDADSQVPTGWLTQMVEFANAGAHLVLGTVALGPGLTSPVQDAWRSQHCTHEGHPHVHGANFGIRADTCTALGGWAPLSTGEDVDLVARAADAKYQIRRTASIPVVTSTRTVGRAPQGFSSYLRTLYAAVPTVRTGPSSPATGRHDRPTHPDRELPSALHICHQPDTINRHPARSTP